MEGIEWSEYERRVVDTVKWCQERNESPLVWSIEMGKWATQVPSPDLGQVLVSHLCFQNNTPSLWKFLEGAMSSGLLFPVQVLSLLSASIIPHRRSQPEAYSLYLQLLNRYALSFNPVVSDVSRQTIINSVDRALKLSEIYDIRVLELGHVFVLFFFSIIIGLIDSVLDDWGLLQSSLERPSLAFGNTNSKDMDIDSKQSSNLARKEHHEELRTKNSFMALEVLGKLTESKKSLLLLRLIHLNMPKKFNGLLCSLQLFKAHHLASSDLNPAKQLLARFSANIERVVDFVHHLDKRQLIGMLVDNGPPCRPVSQLNFESAFSACWVPLDIYMENVMDGKQLVKSAIDVIAEVVITLQILNQASWQETFLALWLSALRLVQRERDPLEGPVPHLEARLCVLLSIVPLAIAKVLEDEDQVYSPSALGNSMSAYEKAHALRKYGLISSLQVLGQFSGLLCPPASVVNAANIAAAKAATHVHNSKNEKGSGPGYGNHGQGLMKAGGNMRHLIVEACIARNLIDASAYFWPCYVVASAITPSDTSPNQNSPWSTFMEGASLSSSLISSLVTTPASSLQEIEKLYHIAVNGSKEEKSAASKILCGASLRIGWNIQEHVVRFVVKLLSPPTPLNSGPRSHLVDHMSMLYGILKEASLIDTVHILSLHGVVPEIAASLVPLCEVFGSLEPTSRNKSSKGDEPNVYMIFSLAFLFLLRLWKFYKPPIEQCITEHARAFRGELTLEYLLLLRNSRSTSFQYETNSNPDHIGCISDKAIYIDSYPKLRSWYCQNKSCVASTLSGLSSESPVHEVSNKILNMVYSKMTITGSSSSGSPASTGEDTLQRPMLPAWEVLEAIPYVLEAILTACAHGRLSSRNLTIGLRDLVDFLPASLATIISYFSAEITRGIWKSVPMNGIDWPSPQAILLTVESEIKEILAAVGVNIPTCSYEASEIVLPLPMAALVSLTITFKLDKSLEYIHAVSGPALENCSSSCPWPSIPVIGCLWAQKIRRWHDFIVVSCSRSVFRQNKEAVAQLLRSCFTAFLGSQLAATTSLSNQSSVNGLLGFTISACSIHPFVAPGFLYLRSCRTIQNVQYVNGVIVGLVAEYAQELSVRWELKECRRLKSSQASLCLATTKAKEVATLGASLLCIAGGFQLVQELYTETIPTWLLSSSEAESKQGEVSAVSCVVEGYAMAYLLILSGSIMWGVQVQQPNWLFTRRARIVEIHMDFLAGVLDGNISLGCHPSTWKAYVSCLVGLLVKFAPAWIQGVNPKTLRTLASGLRGWHECELALSLLERGGTAVMGSAAELVNVTS
ncbi:hypothetical protein CsatB_003151 [Cannabis sativa]